MQRFHRLSLLGKAGVGCLSLVVLVFCIAFSAGAIAGLGKTNATPTAAPIVQATPPATRPPATPTPTKAKPSPMPTPSDTAYNAWLTSEVTSLQQSGIAVTDAIYADASHQIVWIQVSNLNQTAANTFCKQVAHDYVSAFHQYVTVHFYQAPGTSNELARCTDQP